MLLIGGSEPFIEVRELAEYPSHGGSQGFKSPHLHPNTAGQSVASREPATLAALWGRTGAANACGRVDRQSNPSLDGSNDLHSVRLIVPC
jgi:hypothetical protein